MRLPSQSLTRNSHLIRTSSAVNTSLLSKTAHILTSPAASLDTVSKVQCYGMTFDGQRWPFAPPFAGAGGGGRFGIPSGHHPCGPVQVETWINDSLVPWPLTNCGFEPKLRGGTSSLDMVRLIYPRCSRSLLHQQGSGRSLPGDNMISSPIIQEITGLL